RQLWEPLYNYAFSLLADKALARDMVQDVWMNFWERRQEIENNNIKAYLYKAVRFRVFKELRDSRLKESHLEALKTIYKEDSAEESVVPNPEETKELLDKKLAVLPRSEEHTSELQSRENLVCRLLLEKKNK